MRIPCLFILVAVASIPNVSEAQVRRPDIKEAPRVSTARFAQGPEPTPLGELELVPGPDSPSDSAAGLTLAGAEQIALQNNPTLSQAMARVQAARGIWTQVGLYPNPVIGYSAEEMGDEGTSGKQGGFISQRFVTGGKLRLGRAAASQAVARAEQQWAAQELRVLTDVRVRFYDVLIARRKIELTEQLVKIGEAGVKTVQALIKAKEASRVDLLQAQVELDSTRILLTNAQEALRAAWRRLAAVLGRPDMPPGPLSGDAENYGPPLRWEDVFGRLVSQSPELAAAAAEVERARWALQRARVQWIPDVDIETTVQHDNTLGYAVTSIGVALPLPLFDRNQGFIAAANAEAIAAERNLQRIRLSLQDRLAQTFGQYASARSQVEKYKTDILPNAKTSLDLVVAGYEQGEFGYLSLLTAQRTYFQSNLAYFASLRQLRSAAAKIEGLMLDDSLGDRE